MLRVILTIVQVFASFAIIGLVLLQRGKGADAGAGFGAGASGTVFGARGASTALSRATAIFAAIFMINSLLLTYVGTRTVTAAPKTILDTIGEKADKAKSGSTPAGANQTVPVPSAPSPGETAPASTPAGAGTTESTPAPAAAPASGSAAQAPAPAAPASAPARPAPSQGAAPK
jgi:preprotein translocase subunit SecG